MQPRWHIHHDESIIFHAHNLCQKCQKYRVYAQTMNHSKVDEKHCRSIGL